MKLPTTARPDVSENELALRKLDRRDMWWRAFGLLVLLAIAAFNILGIFRLQHIINQNQEGVITFRKANLHAQQQNQAYIKCILLIRYDNPNLTATSARADVSNALDKCAEANK